MCWGKSRQIQACTKQMVPVEVKAELQRGSEVGDPSVEQICRLRQGMVGDRPWKGRGQSLRDPPIRKELRQLIQNCPMREEQLGLANQRRPNCPTVKREEGPGQLAGFPVDVDTSPFPASVGYPGSPGPGATLGSLSLLSLGMGRYWGLSL